MVGVAGCAGEEFDIGVIEGIVGYIEIRIAARRIIESYDEVDSMLPQLLTIFIEGFRLKSQLERSMERLHALYPTPLGIRYNQDQEITLAMLHSS